MVDFKQNKCVQSGYTLRKTVKKPTKYAGFSCSPWRNIVQVVFLKKKGILINPKKPSLL